MTVCDGTCKERHGQPVRIKQDRIRALINETEKAMVKMEHGEARNIHLAAVRIGLYDFLGERTPEGLGMDDDRAYAALGSNYPELSGRL